MILLILLQKEITFEKTYEFFKNPDKKIKFKKRVNQIGESKFKK